MSITYRHMWKIYGRNRSTLFPELQGLKHSCSHLWNLTENPYRVRNCTADTQSFSFRKKTSPTQRHKLAKEKSVWGAFRERNSERNVQKKRRVKQGLTEHLTSLVRFSFGYTRWIDVNNRIRPLFFGLKVIGLVEKVFQIIGYFDCVRVMQ